MKQLVQQGQNTGIQPRLPLKVASHSDPTKVAGAIAGLLEDYSSVEVQAIGAGAVNQATKAIALAQVWSREKRLATSCDIRFADASIDGKNVTAICWCVYVS